MQPFYIFGGFENLVSASMCFLLIWHGQFSKKLDLFMRVATLAFYLHFVTITTLFQAAWAWFTSYCRSRIVGKNRSF